MSDINSLTVVKHNRIIDAEYSMSVCEQRVLLTCIAKIDSIKTLNPERIFTVSVDDIIDLVDVARGSAYQHLKKTCDALFTNVVNIEIPGEDGILKTRWVDAVKYIDKASKIELRFTPEMVPFLTQLSRDFTKYKLVHVLKFKSAYSYRLYELICRWGNGEHTFTVEWLREKFQLFDKYERVVDFKNNVIDVAVGEINATSDIKVTYEQIKKGRNIVAFRFIYTRKRHRNTTKTISNSVPAQITQLEKSDITGEIDIDIVLFNDNEKLLAKNSLAKVSEASQHIILKMFKSALAKGDVKYPLRYLTGLVSKSLSGDLDITAFEREATPNNTLEKQTRRAKKVRETFAKHTNKITDRLAQDGHVFIKGEGTVVQSEFEALGLIDKALRTNTKSITLSELMDKALLQENLRKENEIIQKKVNREYDEKQPKDVVDVPIVAMSEKEIATRQKILELEAQLIATGEFTGVNTMAIGEDEMDGLAELESVLQNFKQISEKKK